MTRPTVALALLAGCATGTVPPADVSAPLAAPVAPSLDDGHVDAGEYIENAADARDSLAREVKRAAFVLVALPYGEYQRTGPAAAAKSVLRGVPVAIIRPLIGATQAVSSTLLGFRNALDPDSQMEAMQKFKSERVDLGGGE